METESRQSHQKWVSYRTERAKTPSWVDRRSLKSGRGIQETPNYERLTQSESVMPRIVLGWEMILTAAIISLEMGSGRSPLGVSGLNWHQGQLCRL